jgi:hypothetical protein
LYFLWHTANPTFTECIFATLSKLVVCRVPGKMHFAKSRTLGKQPMSGNDAYLLYKQTSELVYATTSTVSMELSLLCPSSAQEE